MKIRKIKAAIEQGKRHLKFKSPRNSVEGNNIRDLIYISGSLRYNAFHSHGIEFNELIASVNFELKNLLLLNHDFADADFHTETRFDYIDKSKMELLLKDDIYRYGDFICIDFNDLHSLNSLVPMEIAELLYFKHFNQPLNNIFISKIENRMAYYGHDDGWFSKVYFKEAEDYYNVLANVIKEKASRFSDCNFIELSNATKRKIVKLSEEGILFDYSKMILDKAEIRLPFKIIGNYFDMDKVFDIRNQIKNYDFWLVHKEKEWNIVSN